MVFDLTSGAQRQGTIRAKGVVLRRLETTTGDRNIYFFLEKYGPTWIYVPGGGRGKFRFGGATEPLVWGTVDIYRTSNNRCYLKNLDVKEDFWTLRKIPDRLKFAMEWAKLLAQVLLPQEKNDEVLGLFYWSMKLLEDFEIPPELVEWRFLSRWLKLWGIAPETRMCSECRRQESKWWLLTSEGIFCDECKREQKGGVKVDSFFLSVLNKSSFLKRPDFVEWSKGLDWVQLKLIKKCNRVLLETLRGKYAT